MQAAWWVLLGFAALGLSLGPLNDVCCFVGINADYSTIQAAVDAARPGSTVVVFPGIYRENLLIDKPLRLVNAEYTLFSLLSNGNPPLIQAKDNAKPTVEIGAPNVTVQGFIVRGGQTGFQIRNTHHIRVLDNRIMQSQEGIRIEQTAEVWVRNNHISGNDRTGIFVLDSRHIRLLSNTLEYSSDGIFLQNTRLSLLKNNVIEKHTSTAITLLRAPQNVLLGNEVKDQGAGLLLENSPKTKMGNNRLAAGNASFWVEGTTVQDFVHDIGTSNTLGGLPIIYLNGLKNRRLKPGLKPGFLALINASNVTVSNLEARDVPVGALLVNSKDIKFRQATMDGNRIGIRAIHSVGITITDSTVSHSVENGLHLVDVNDVNIKRLTVSSSGDNGIYLLQGENFSLEDSEISSSGVSAAWLENVSRGFFINNTLSQNAQYAVLLKNTREMTLKNNTLNANQTGLYLDEAVKNLVENNTIQQNQWGIFLQGAAENTITQNILTLNQRGGIRGLTANNTIENNVEEKITAEDVKTPNEVD